MENKKQNPKIKEQIIRSFEDLIDEGSVSADQADQIMSIIGSSSKIGKSTIQNIENVNASAAAKIKDLLGWTETIGEISVLNVSDSTPLKAIVEEIAKEGEFLGMGELADVKRSTQRGEGNFCIKQITRTTQKTLYTNPIDQEMEMQEIAAEILNKAASSGVKTAIVPLPILYAKTTEGIASIAMEFIEGKTLWRLILEEIIKDIPITPFYRNEDLLSYDDTELELAVIDMLGLATKPGREIYKRITALARKKRFFQPEIYEQIENAIKTLNQNHLYHRDLHEKNIMVGPSGRVYFIDFGSTIYGKTDSPYDTTVLGQKLRFAPDNSVLGLLKDICIKSETKATKEAKIQEIRDKKALEQLTKWLKQRERIDLNKVFEDAEKQAGSAKELVELIAVQIHPVIYKYLHNLDLLEKIIKIISRFEKEKYGNTEASRKYFYDLAVEKNIIPLQNFILKLN